MHSKSSRLYNILVDEMGVDPIIGHRMEVACDKHRYWRESTGYCDLVIAQIFRQGFMSVEDLMQTVEHLPTLFKHHKRIREHIIENGPMSIEMFITEVNLDG